MDRRTFLMLLTAAPAVVPALIVAQESTPSDAVGWAALPPGARYEPIVEASLNEAVAVANIVSVARVTLPDGVNRFQRFTSPCALLMRSGALTFRAADDVTEPSVLVRSPDDGGTGLPAVVMPGSRLDMKPGDLLTLPWAAVADTDPPYWSFSTDEQTEYLFVEFFPAGVPAASFMETTGGAVEFLDLPLSLATARPSAPAVFALGRLVLDAGTEVALPRAPALLLVEGGTMAVKQAVGRADIQRAGTDIEATPETLEAGGTADMGAGDAAALLPGTGGVLSAIGGGPLDVLSLVVVPELEVGTR